MVIFFVDSFMIAVFLLFALGVGYQAYLALHGVMFVLTMIFFLAITAFTVFMLVMKAMGSRSSRLSKPLVLWNLFLSLIASAISLYTCNLFMQDLRLYDDSLWGMVGLIIGVIVGGFLWLTTTAGWIQALGTDEPASFSYKGFLLELIAAGAFYALVNF